MNPDPVRPVAPREDEAWFRNLNEGVRQLVFEQASRKTRLHLLAAIDEAIDRLLAAAPVPCAASPADKYYEDADSLIATVTTYCNHGRDEEAKQLIVSWLATLIEQDRIERERAAVYQRACVCGHDLGDHGFGIDLALECCNCDCRKFARATGEGARDGAEGLRAADLPAPAGAQAAETAPVVVSLDPHRLERELWFLNLLACRVLVAEQASRGARPHLLAGLDEAIARLRGEAAVRPDDEWQLLRDLGIALEFVRELAALNTADHKRAADLIQRAQTWLHTPAAVRVEE